MAYKSLEQQMEEILDKYKEIPREVSEKCSRQAARDAANKLKNTSPRRPGGGEYASGWSTKKVGKGYVTYNRKAPGLTHLLEKSHVISNKYGEYGRSTPHVHIAPVAEEFERQYLENVERELNKKS
jgi:hypothetical protein